MRKTAMAVAALMLSFPGGEIGGQTPARPASAFEVGVGPVAGQGSGLGVHGTAGYVTAPTHFGLSIRLEGTFATWRLLQEGRTTGELRFYQAGASVVQVLSRRSFQPYLSAGAAGYAQQGRGAELSFNAGVGFRFRVGSASLFTEARVHRIGIGDDPRVTPLTFGIRF